MNQLHRHSGIAVLSECLAKSMVYGVGYLMARKMETTEFGHFSAALAFAQGVSILVDSGMGQIMAKNIAKASAVERSWLNELFTWRFLVSWAAGVLTFVIGRWFLPPPAYRTALWLTPVCLLIGMVDWSAWVFKGLQRVSSYGAVLLGSRGFLAIFCVVSLYTAHRIQSMLVAYWAAGIASGLLALGLWSHGIGPLRLVRLGWPFLRKTVPEIYQYSLIIFASAIMVRIDLMLVAKYGGEVQAGLYGCAAFITDALTLIPMAVYGIALPAFAGSRERPDALAAMFKGLYRWLVVSSIVLVIAGPLAIKPFLLTFFGIRYAMSGVCLNALLWSCVPYYVNVLLWAILLIHNDFKTLAISIIMGLSVEVFLCLILLPQHGMVAAAWARVSGMTGVVLGCMYGVLKLKILSWNDLLLRPGLALGSALLTKAFLSGQPAWLSMLAAVGVALALFLPLPLEIPWNSIWRSAPETD